MVAGVWVLSVLVDEAVFAAGTVCAGVLGAGAYDRWELWGFCYAGIADGSAAWSGAWAFMSGVSAGFGVAFW